MSVTFVRSDGSRLVGDRRSPSVYASFQRAHLGDVREFDKLVKCQRRDEDTGVGFEFVALPDDAARAPLNPSKPFPDDVPESACIHASPSESVFVFGAPGGGLCLCRRFAGRMSKSMEWRLTAWNGKMILWSPDQLSVTLTDIVVSVVFEEWRTMMWMENDHATVFAYDALRYVENLMTRARDTSKVVFQDSRTVDALAHMMHECASSMTFPMLSAWLFDAFPMYRQVRHVVSKMPLKQLLLRRLRPDVLQEWLAQFFSTDMVDSNTLGWLLVQYLLHAPETSITFTYKAWMDVAVNTDDMKELIRQSPGLAAAFSMLDAHASTHVCAVDPKYLSDKTDPDRYGTVIACLLTPETIRHDATRDEALRQLALSRIFAIRGEDLTEEAFLPLLLFYEDKLYARMAGCMRATLGEDAFRGLMITSSDSGEMLTPLGVQLLGENREMVLAMWGPDVLDEALAQFGRLLHCYAEVGFARTVLDPGVHDVDPIDGMEFDNDDEWVAVMAGCRHAMRVDNLFEAVRCQPDLLQSEGCFCPVCREPQPNIWSDATVDVFDKSVSRYWTEPAARRLTSNPEEFPVAEFVRRVKRAMDALKRMLVPYHLELDSTDKIRDVLHKLADRAILLPSLCLVVVRTIETIVKNMAESRCPSRNCQLLFFFAHAIKVRNSPLRNKPALHRTVERDDVREFMEALCHLSRLTTNWDTILTLAEEVANSDDESYGRLVTRLEEVDALVASVDPETYITAGEDAAAAASTETTFSHQNVFGLIDSIREALHDDSETSSDEEI